MLNKKNIIALLMLVLSGISSGTSTAYDLKTPKVYELTLMDVTELAIKNSFDIRLAQQDVAIVQVDRQQVESVYDTFFKGRVFYQNDQSQKTSTILASKTLLNQYDIGLEKNLPTGTKINLDLQNDRTWSNSAFSTNALTHDSTLGLSIEQSLGKNLLGMQDRGSVKAVEAGIESMKLRSLYRIEQLIAQVQQSYWNLVLQKEIIAIQKESVEQAKWLHDLHQEKLKDGLIEEPEVLASKANYKRRLIDLALLNNQYKEKSNILRLLVNLDQDAMEIIPQDSLDIENQNKEIAVSLKKAFEQRSDYKEAVNLVKENDIDLDMQKNNLWPEINLIASLERNGLGDHFDQSVTQITDEDNPNFTVGMTVRIPLENNDARSRLEKSRLIRTRSLLELKYLERAIALEVLDKVRNANVYRSTVLNDKEVANLQLEKFKEEQNRFNRGRSDTDTLIRFQDDVLNAQRQAIQSKFRYKLSLINLALAEGSLLKKYWKQ